MVVYEVRILIDKKSETLPDLIEEIDGTLEMIDKDRITGIIKKE